MKIRRVSIDVKKDDRTGPAGNESVRTSLRIITTLFGVAFTLCISFFICAAQEKSIEPDENAMVILPKTILFRSVDAVKNIPIPTVSQAKFSETSDGRGYKTTLDVIFKSRFTKTKPVLTEHANAFISGNQGRSWRSQELGMDPADRDHRLCSFRSQKPGSEILVSLLARNDLNGYMIELACEQKNAPAPSPAFSGLNEPQPRGCLFSAETENPPIDDPPGRAGEDLDILDVRIGHNKNHLFFLMRVQGEISHGSLTPTILHQYSFMIFDPDGPTTTPEGAMPLNGVMLRYIPFGVSSPNFVQPCGAVVIRNNAPVVETKNVDCKTDGPFLVFRVNKKLWENKFPRELLILAGTGTLRNRTLSEFSFVDSTNLTRVRLGARKYKFGSQITAKLEPVKNDF